MSHYLRVLETVGNVPRVRGRSAGDLRRVDCRPPKLGVRPPPGGVDHVIPLLFDLSPPYVSALTTRWFRSATANRSRAPPLLSPLQSYPTKPMANYDHAAAPTRPSCSQSRRARRAQSPCRSSRTSRRSSTSVNQIDFANIGWKYVHICTNYIHREYGMLEALGASSPSPSSPTCSNTDLTGDRSHLLHAFRDKGAHAW